MRLGAFELKELLGRGGMGLVYRGVHRRTGTPVAVKLLTAERFAEPAARTHFEHEVRAFARLDHPAIVLVYDHGFVPDEDAAASDGKLIAGAPYLVMELATDGTLEHFPPKSWPELAAILRCVLDALAHAHARGVVHRDIKLANILLAGPQDVRPGLKLGDFGTAHDLDVDESLPDEILMVGTPSYTPPEQIFGRWRDFGPWTDLYALGVAAWVMVTGAPPFKAVDIHALLNMHVRVPPPPLVPKFEVPEGLDGWLRTMLAKDPADRFRRAADAAWALEKLALDPGTVEELGPAADGRVPDDSTSALDPLTGMIPSDGLATRPFPPAGARETGAGGAAATPDADQPTRPMSSRQLMARAESHEASPAPEPPPLPRTWRRHDRAPAALQLGGAGLGLYGLRAHPLVGREDERDRIWEQLGAVVRGEGARVVVLEGYSGLGKSHLARWIAERAHELGGATVLPVYHGPRPGRLPPLLRTFEGYFGATKMGRRSVRARVQWMNAKLGCRDEYEADAVTELLRPAGAEEVVDADVSAVHFSSPAERYNVLERVLVRQASRRAVILLIEDAQWGFDALGLVEHLLNARRPEPLRVLALVTMRQRIGPGRTPEAELVERLLERDDATHVDVGLLPEKDVLAFVRDLLGISGELAHEVATRAGGGPLFAVQLVTDWIERGLLVPAAHGFELRPGARTELPDDIHTLWTDILDRMLAPYPKRARVALELAAALGREVDSREWASLCSRAGFRVPTRLLDALIARNLAVPIDGGWAFVHGLLAESVERSSKEAGRWKTHHQRCVAMLRDAGAAPDRLGRHLLAAGETRDAIDALLAAAERAFTADEYKTAADLLHRRERAMERIDFVAADARWGRGWVLRGLVLWRIGELEAGDALVRRAEEEATDRGWTAVLARALEVRARIERYRGNLDEAVILARRGLGAATDAGDDRLVAHARRTLGRTLVDRVRFDEAAAELSAARATFEALNDLPGLIACERTLYSIARQRGDLDEAGRIAEELRSIQELRGHRWGMGLALECLGEVARHRGEMEAAEAHYREALACFRSVTDTDPRNHASTVNIALTLLARDRFDEAHALLEEAAAELAAAKSRTLHGITLAMLAATSAGRQDWDAFDAYLGDADAILRPIRLADVDLALVAMETADRAAAAGFPLRERQVLLLALEQWDLLGREADADAVRDRLRP